MQGHPATRESTPHRTRRMRAVEERFGEDLAVLLHRLRFQDGLTTKEIAGRIEVPKVTVDHWLQQLELTFVAMARKSA